MADVDLTVQDISRAGIVATYMDSLDPVDDFFFSNNERVFVHIKNGSTASVMTIESVQVIDGLAVADRSINLAASVDRFIGPFPAGVYNNADRKVHLEFTTPDTVEIAVLRAEL